MNKITGGTAFPAEIYVNPDVSHYTEGMTLRDYFAAKALQGFCAAHDTGEWSPSFMAESAYKMADAMLKAKEQA